MTLAEGNYWRRHQPLSQAQVSNLELHSLLYVFFFILCTFKVVLNPIQKFRLIFAES